MSSAIFLAPVLDVAFIEQIVTFFAGDARFEKRAHHFLVLFHLGAAGPFGRYRL
jgi:hypothetical protein